MPPRQPKPLSRTERPTVLDLEGFADRAHDRREDLDLTQKEVARHVGCTAGMVRRYERGQNFPTALNLVRLAEVLKTSIDFLVLGRTFGGLIDRRLIDSLRALQRLPPERLNDFLGVAQTFLEPQPNAPRQEARP